MIKTKKYYKKIETPAAVLSPLQYKKSPYGGFFVLKFPAWRAARHAGN